MRNAKLITGVILIAAAAGSLVFWESQGRSMIFETGVVAASADIMQGDILSEKNIEVKSIGSEYVMKSAVKEGGYSDMLGRKAKQYIPAGSQISDDFIADNGDIVLKEGESVYCISEDMIGMVSSSLRRGDRVHIYGGAGKEDLGSYTVAFVKDSADREVRNASELKIDLPLEREDSNYTISSIEIVCTRDAYAQLSDYTAQSENTLTVVQEAK